MYTITCKALLVLCCLGDVAFVQSAVKLSDFVSKCSLRDPNQEECLTTQAKALLPHFVKGVREWGILPMDPLLVPYVNLQQGNVDAGGIFLNGTDTSHYGWKEMDIKSIRMNPENYEIELKALLPSYNVQGTYSVDGKILSLPLQGTGFMNCTFQNVDLKMTISITPENRGGKTYLKITKATCVATLKHINFQLDNLFGNKQLSDTTNAVLTENSLEVFKDLKGPLQNLFSDIVKGILSRFFSKVPINQFFKEEA